MRVKTPKPQYNKQKRDRLKEYNLKYASKIDNSSLSIKQKTLIHRYYVDGDSYSAIALNYKTSRQVIYQMVKSAIKQLKGE